jgi:DMSO/TMAO reductase YedYZ molybdopterin-dependent catalytic subunit
MTRRATNLALLGLTGGLVASGLAPWILPEPSAVPLYLVHRALGVALILTLVAKYGIARASVRRRLRRGVAPSLVVGILGTAALAITVGLGVAWTFGLVSFDSPWSYSALNVHVVVGLGLFALVALHTAARWERRPALVRSGRRNALRLALLGGGAIALTAWLERFADERRVTGSKHAGSFNGNAFPLTIWNFDTVPSIDPATWRLEVTGAIATAGTLSYAELMAAPSREVVALIDCTGGWWSGQRWRGARVGDLLAAHGPDDNARSATVVSVTGHRWTFPLAELDDAVLATHVGGEPLSAGHGAPIRLVVPGRRGFQWIKWVARIEVA